VVVVVVVVVVVYCLVSEANLSESLHASGTAASQTLDLLIVSLPPYPLAICLISCS